MKFSVIGCGAAGAMHAEALQMAGLELGYCFDEQAGKALAFSERWQCKPAVSATSLLWNSEAAIIATPPSTHKELIIKAAQIGTHILCEKPLATSVEDAEFAVGTAEHCGVALGVVSQRRWETRPNLSELGVVVGAYATCYDYKSPESYERAEWRRSWEGAGGGVLMQQAPHLIDLLCHYLGEPIEAEGVWSSLAEHSPMDDTVKATVRFDSGALGHLMASTATPGKTGYYSLRLVGAAANYEIEFPPLRPKALAAQLEDFAAAVEIGKLPASSGREGLTVVKVIEAIYRSGRLGGEPCQV